MEEKILDRLLGASWFLVTPMSGLLRGSVTDPGARPLKAVKVGERLPRCQHLRHRHLESAGPAASTPALGAERTLPPQSRGQTSPVAWILLPDCESGHTPSASQPEVGQAGGAEQGGPQRLH